MVCARRSRARSLPRISISPYQSNGSQGGIMKHDDIFSAPEKPAFDFEFDAEVAFVFDDMLERSVPFYLEQQNMIQTMSKSFWLPDTHVYDLGCSTGTTLEGL